MESAAPQFGSARPRLAGHGSPVTARRSRLAGHGSPVIIGRQLTPAGVFQNFQADFPSPRRLRPSPDGRLQNPLRRRLLPEAGLRKSGRVCRNPPDALRSPPQVLQPPEWVLQSPLPHWPSRNSLFHSYLQLYRYFSNRRGERAAPCPRSAGLRPALRLRRPISWLQARQG